MEYDVDYFNDLIHNSKNYFAHLSKSENQCSNELLSEHSALVYAYARLIAGKQNLNSIIKNLIDGAIPVKIKINRQLLTMKIENFFWRAIAYHDLGKVNREFQRARMNNDACLLDIHHKFGSGHSVIGMYIFLADFWQDFIRLKLSDEEQVFICNVVLYFSYSIYRHHDSNLDKAQDIYCWNNSDLYDLRPFITLFDIKLSDAQIEEFHKYFLRKANFDFLFQWFNGDVHDSINDFPLFALLKLNYSLLTSSDYLATAHYMNNWNEKLSDFGLIDFKLREKIIHNVTNTRDYNRKVYNYIESGKTINSYMLKNQSNANLNLLRQSIAMDVILNVRQNIDKRLFYIEAPTGGGKTNASILASAEILRGGKNKLINKIFYVFPFTTLITQTYKTLSDTLGLNDCEIAEIHSKASSQTGRYEEDYKNYLDNLFMNYPIILLSHVVFFDVLKTNRKDRNYLLQRLANSIVIIDEIQSYSPKIWDKIVYFIANYAKYFNMKFIVMSATLPKLGNIIDNKDLASEFVYLVNDKNQYFHNPNFCNRVKIDYSLLSHPKPKSNDRASYLSNLRNIVFNNSSDYSDRHGGRVYTIVEFIFKKTASDFYALVNLENNFFDNIFLLSGTILEPRRKEIIGVIKSDEYKAKKILLVSTQVVEAGIDIDMDLGFKDKSLIDSDEQLAGRINRNIKKKDCKLFLFDCDQEKTLYGDDERYAVMHKLDDEYSTILETKNFDRLYELVIEKIKERNKSQYIVNLDSELIDKIKMLDFKGVSNSLKIINTQTVSVFVPLQINAFYLKGFIKDLDEFKISHDSYVSGVDIWNIYESIANHGTDDFVLNKIKINKLERLMSNFVFSIFPMGRDYSSLLTYGEEKLGFLYLENFNNVYSLENGINTRELCESNFL